MIAVLLAQAVETTITFGQGITLVGAAGGLYTLIKIGDRLWLGRGEKTPEKPEEPIQCRLHEARLAELEKSVKEISLCTSTIVQQTESIRVAQQELYKKMFVGNGTKSVVSRLDMLEARLPAQPQ